MGKRVIAAAQSISVAGDIEANVQRHLIFMHAAIERSANILLFPELSLTGYERDLAQQLAINLSDPRLQPMHQLARDSGMITVVGAPVRLVGVEDVLIGALVLGGPEIVLYSKQHLHPGEDEVFSPGQGGASVVSEHDNIVLAVCADFSHASHARAAANVGATIYAASVLITEGGYLADSALLARYALEHQMVVLMANHGGPTGGWGSAGRSALWAADGTLVEAIEGPGNKLLVSTYDSGTWITELIAMQV